MSGGWGNCMRNFQREDCAQCFTMPILITFMIKVGQYKCLMNIVCIIFYNYTLNVLTKTSVRMLNNVDTPLTEVLRQKGLRRKKIGRS